MNKENYIRNFYQGFLIWLKITFGIKEFFHYLQKDNL